MTTYMNLEKYEGEEDTSHPLDRGLEISLTIPDQEEVDDGMKPWVSVDALRLLREAQYQSNTDLGTAFYTLDFEKLLESYVEEEGRHGPVFQAHAADTLADWLESWAASLREKYVTEERLRQYDEFDRARLPTREEANRKSSEGDDHA